MAIPRHLIVTPASTVSVAFTRPAFVCTSCASWFLLSRIRPRQSRGPERPHPQSSRFSTIARRRESVPTPSLSQPSNIGNVSLGTDRFIAIRGNDATKFLQGLTTNNVIDGAEEAVYNSAFLNAQGRIEWDAQVYRLRDETDGSWYWLLEVDAGRRDGLLKHLMKHKLRSKVKVQKVDNLQSHFSWGGGSESSSPTEGFTTMDPRLNQLGTRSIRKSTESEAGFSTSSASADQLLQYTLRRYLHGIPEGPEEMIPGHALPQESNLDHLNGVDFKKGCYVGQELTIRTQHTGVVRKRILPVQLYTNDSAAPDALQYVGGESIPSSILQAVKNARSTDGPIDIVKVGSGSGSRGRSAGKLLAHVGNVGLALCRLEMMTDLRISAEGGSWQPSDEFMLKAGTLSEESGARDTKIKIKAFVPAWLRAKIEADFLRKRARSEQI